MKIRRVAAEQAHSVPSQSYRTPGLFDYEITRSQTLAIGDEELDEAGQSHPLGSTAQNNFREVKFYRCNTCGEILRETHVDSHICQEDQ